MNRRQFIAVGAGWTVAIALGTATIVWGIDGGYTLGSAKSETQAQPVDEVPTVVTDRKPLASDFYAHISQHVEGASVYITRDGQLAMTYETSAESGHELTAEYNRIALEYARFLEDSDYEPVTLTMVIGQTQALVPSSTLTAYTNGEINKDAFLETIEVIEVARSERSD